MTLKEPGGLDCTERTSIVVYDLNPDVGNIFAAFHKARAKYTGLSLHYVGTCYTQMHQEWFQKIWLDELASQFSKGELKIAGFTPKSSETPTHLLESCPPKPALSVMTWMADVEGEEGRPRGIKVPVAIMAQWYQHQIFGPEFRIFFDKLSLECGTGDDNAGSPQKRKPDAALAIANKHQKLNEFTYLENSVITGPFLATVPLLSIKAATPLVMKVGGATHN
jgi:hypothetical protein